METVGISTISKGEEKRRYLPLEIRSQMYDDVIKLRKQGLNYIQIQKEIYEKYGLRLPQPTISTWINRKKHPLGRVNKFDDKPSPELAYVIGAIFGDGSLYFDKHYFHFLILLAVNDKEFANEFGKNLAKVLGKKGPYKPFWDEHRKQWVVEVTSILLYKFLNKPLRELKPYIEYSNKTASAFLRALFDGEGCMFTKRYPKKYIRTLRLYSTDKELLNYAKFLLEKYFNINTTGPHLERKSGEVKHFPNGRITKTTKDFYYLYIRTNSLLNFYKFINFSIKRKQQRLIEAIKQ
ncbi:MAG: LAGLIDADG family homing endonuclease [Nitrososphaerota archaeon]